MQVTAVVCENGQRRNPKYLNQAHRGDGVSHRTSGDHNSILAYVGRLSNSVWPCQSLAELRTVQDPDRNPTILMLHPTSMFVASSNPVPNYQGIFERRSAIQYLGLPPRKTWQWGLSYESWIRLAFHVRSWRRMPAYLFFRFSLLSSKALFSRSDPFFGGLLISQVNMSATSPVCPRG